jgi:outer membrane lipoprotein LolB
LLRFPKRFTAPLLAAVLLVSCAVSPTRPPVPDPEAAWRAHRAALESVASFRIQGKLGVRTPRRGGQASIQWTREAGAQTINLYGPFSSGHLLLTEDSAGAVLKSGQGTNHAPTAEQVLEESTGWRVPFAALRFWALGLPDPAAPNTTRLDEFGRLTRLEQHGWVIEYLDYGASGALELPARLFLKTRTEHPDDALPEEGRFDVEVRLVVREWKL